MGSKFMGPMGIWWNNFFALASTTVPMLTADLGEPHAVCTGSDRRGHLGFGRADRVGFRVSPIYADVNEDRGEPDVMGTYGALADALAERNLHHLDVVESFVVGEREPGLDAICPTSAGF